MCLQPPRTPVGSGTRLGAKCGSVRYRFKTPPRRLTKRVEPRGSRAGGTTQVLVNVRMTVVALKGGGLWVYNPVAPTPECVRQMRELEAQYGPVKYVVLGTYAVEHKVCGSRRGLTPQAFSTATSQSYYLAFQLSRIL
jgi:hypothetical protein